MPYNAEKNELEILKYWDKVQAFEKSVDERPEDKPYVFYDGPPFATGLPHYGHILSSVIKDVVPRYWTMKGYRVRRRWGWDCHGLPIENLVEKELKISGKKQIEKMGVDNFNEICHSKVLQYTNEWKKMVERIGRWVEFDNAYKTMDSAYMESVWWALKAIWDKGLIYEGRKALMYCPRCETPVSKAEVAMDDSYRDIAEEAVIVKFPISSPAGGRSKGDNFQFPINDELKISNGKPLYVLAWTTTPWTLPGNVALAVGANIIYWILDVGTEYVIVARDRADEVLRGRPYKVVGEIAGDELIGLEYEPLFGISAVRNSGKKAWYVASADFVTTVEGTGIVHTAVIYGEDDYNLGLKIDLPMVPLLDEKGVFNKEAPALIQGQYFKESEKIIKDDLEKRGLLFSRSSHTHSYPHCWRCGTQLFYNAISAWFINIQKIKKRMVELNERINWYPEHLKYGRFLNILETAPDWNISRNRYWATPLPFWRCDNKSQKSKITTATAGSRLGGKSQKFCDGVVCIGSVKELKEKAINFDEVYKTDKAEEMDLHKHLADKIKLRCDRCGGVMTRVGEVIDCWVESASMPFAEFHYPFENKEVFENRFPGDYIAEYIAQTRAWFYYMHAMAVLLFDEVSFKNCVTTGTILNEKGEKLSKSKMNYTDPWVIIERYGVDALRYYLMTSVVMEADNLFFNDNDVKDAYNKVINILWNVVEFYGMYSGCHPRHAPPLAGLRCGGAVGESGDPVASPPGLDSRLHGNDKLNVLDKWILSKLQLLVKEVTGGMDNYDTVKASRPIKGFIDDLSTWYVRRSRDRFKGEDMEDKVVAVSTLGHVLLTLSKVMAPFTPFIAEKTYQFIANSSQPIENCKESVHLEMWPEADESLIDEDVLRQMQHAMSLVHDGHTARALRGKGVRQPLSEMRVGGVYKLDKKYLDIVKDELNVKEITFIDDKGKPEGNEWFTVLDSEGPTDDERGYYYLNFYISDELRQEGLAREVIRAINQLRKEQKLTIKDIVTIEYNTDDEEFLSVLAEYNGEIKKSVLATELTLGKGEVKVEVGGKKLMVSIIKQ